MKIFLFGGSGLVGKEIQKQFVEHEIYAPPHSVLDIENTVAVRDELKKGYDLVINAAGFTDVDGAETDEEGALRLNAEAVCQLALSTFGHSIPLVHISSLYIFDGSISPAPHPMNFYGWTKLLGEICVRTINPRHYILRTVRLFGDAGSGKRSFVDIVKEMPVEASFVVDEYASPTYVKDFVAEMKRLIDEKKPYMTYNIVNAGPCSWMEFAKEICRLIGKEQNFKAISRNEYYRKAKRPNRLDFFTALRPWQEALKEYLGV